jgi:nitrogenase molybdenum-iron protein alpha chain
LHSYDYSGPYAAFTGAINFYQEVDRMLTTKVWKFITPPWEKDPLSAAPLEHCSRNARKEEAKNWRKPAAADGGEPV